MESKLNVNIPKAANKFESLVERVLPKRIFYKMLLRGKGLDFDGYRDLAPDDDSSIIDWKASTRSNKLLTRKYIEERDVRVLFVIDVSDSMIFGSGKKLKCEYSAEIAGAMGKVLLNDPRDRLGFVLYNDKIIESRMPEPGKKQYETFVYMLTNPKNYGGSSNLKKILDELVERLDPLISLIVIISDFINIDKKTINKLESISGLIETIAIIVKDPLDLTFPNVDREVVLEDPNSGERLLVNPKVAKTLYEKNARKMEKKVRIGLRKANIDNVKIMTNKDFCPRLAMFLKRRTFKRD